MIKMHTENTMRFYAARHFLAFSTKKLVLIGALLLCTFYIAAAQTIPVGNIAIEDYYRRTQLMGELDPTVSFTIRPLTPLSSFGKKNAFNPDSTLTPFNLFGIQSSYPISSTGIRVTLLPVSIQTQTNTDHPYGWNDGAMIPAKGFQSLISAGVFAEWGPISVQFRPEFVNAINSDFETFNAKHFDLLFVRYYDYYNRIDAPVRFGAENFTKAYLGQSSIRVNYKGFSAGFSTENLWWGPGMRNSLLMSNTAPGFKHLTLNTTKPFNTPIGSFEGQLIAGRLEGSGFGVLVPEKTYEYGRSLYLPKPNDWRLLSGFVLTWHPKWVSGLFLGLTRTKQMYSKDVNGIGDYFPVFTAKKRVAADEGISHKDYYSSFFFRWVWEDEHAELYGEFGRNNPSRSARQAALLPESSRAYVVGLRKMANLPGGKESKLLFNVEVAQLQQTQVQDILDTKSWYVNSYIRHGYTNKGEMLGAGVGPGGNSQTFGVSWLNGFKRIGLEFERYVHNNDYYFYTFIENGDIRRHWTDLSIAATGEWNIKSLIVNAKVQGTNTLNYQWYLPPHDTSVYFVNSPKVVNFQVQLGLQYIF